MAQLNAYFSYPLTLSVYANGIAQQLAQRGYLCVMAGMCDDMTRINTCYNNIADCECFVLFISDLEDANTCHACIVELQKAKELGKPIVTFKSGSSTIADYFATYLNDGDICVISEQYDKETYTQMLINDIISKAGAPRNAYMNTGMPYGMGFGQPQFPVGMGFGQPQFPAGMGMGFGQPQFSYGAGGFGFPQSPYGMGMGGFGFPQGSFGNPYATASDDGSSQVKEGDGYMDQALTEGRSYYNKAFACYEKAADRGNAEGMAKLGYLYGAGWGTEQNYKKATEWYQKAADKGNLEAMAQLGDCYRLGFGVARDHSRGRKLLQEAANGGCITAKCILAYTEDHDSPGHAKGGKAVVEGTEANNPQALYYMAWRWLEMHRTDGIRHRDPGCLKQAIDHCKKAKDLHHWPAANIYVELCNVQQKFMESLKRRWL